MFINVRLNRENALDMQPMRDRIKSIENQDIGFKKTNLESKAVSSRVFYSAFFSILNPISTPAAFPPLIISL